MWEIVVGRCCEEIGPGVVGGVGNSSSSHPDKNLTTGEFCTGRGLFLVSRMGSGKNRKPEKD